MKQKINLLQNFLEEKNFRLEDNNSIIGSSNQIIKNWDRSSNYQTFFKPQKEDSRLRIGGQKDLRVYKNYEPWELRELRKNIIRKKNLKLKFKRRNWHYYIFKNELSKNLKCFVPIKGNKNEWKNQFFTKQSIKYLYGKENIFSLNQTQTNETFLINYFKSKRYSSDKKRKNNLSLSDNYFKRILKFKDLINRRIDNRNNSQSLLTTLETRLDIIICRLNWATSLKEAHTLINKGYIYIYNNNYKTNFLGMNKNINLRQLTNMDKYMHIKPGTMVLLSEESLKDKNVNINKQKLLTLWSKYKDQKFFYKKIYSLLLKKNSSNNSSFNTPFSDIFNYLSIKPSDSRNKNLITLLNSVLKINKLQKNKEASYVYKLLFNSFY